MNQLVEKILAEIRNRRPIPFARFMECALYCPVYGYYEKEEDTVGRRGDYYTSLSVGPLFGELLALQFADWLGQLHPTPADSPVHIVEAGAHQGHLARDVLMWLRAQRPELCQAIQYCIIEPSSRRQEWQQRTLAKSFPQVRWVNSLAELADSLDPSGGRNSRPVRGILFSNELLDALPVHRFGWDAARSVWFQWGVTFANGRFAWTRLTEQQSEPLQPQLTPQMTLNSPEAPSALVPAWPVDFLKALPDGFTLELCPAASQWWAQAAEVIDCGKLLTIDYGLETDELFSPGRAGGTLRAYRHHRLTPDVLQNPGEQDITAHVNFSAIREIGESAGLKTDAFLSQEQFLTRIAAPVLSGQTPFGEWTRERTRQFQTLTHPNQLGRAFRVLVQSR